MPYEHFKGSAEYASRFMDSVGDGSGLINMNVDGSTTVQEFKLTCPEGYVYLLNRLILYIEDTGSFDTGYYGNGIVMTNGIKGVLRRADASETEMYAQKAIKTNGDWASYCYDVDKQSWGSGNEFMSVRFTFTKDGAAIKLNAGDSAVMQIRDDLTGLVTHNARMGLTATKI